MRRFAVGAVLGLSLASCYRQPPAIVAGHCPAPGLIVSRRTPSGKTNYRSRFGAPELGELRPELHALRGPGSLDQQWIELISLSRVWRFSSCHEVSVLADGDPVTLGKPVIGGEVVGGGFVFESIHLPLPAAALARLAAAESVDFKVCTTSFRADGEFWCSLREFARDLREEDERRSPEGEHSPGAPHR